MDLKPKPTAALLKGAHGSAGGAYGSWRQTFPAHRRLFEQLTPKVLEALRQQCVQPESRQAQSRRLDYEFRARSFTQNKHGMGC
jgi:hypothetical protein